MFFVLPFYCVRAYLLTLTETMSTGKDGTDAFEDVGHSDEARALLPKMLVGTIEDGFVSPCFNS
jgi:hypothetical protein